jgi:mannose-6-phosphate isomerase-like protein (cupin superfamily)
MNSDRINRGVRRIVTGHNADAKAVIAADEHLDGAPLAEDEDRTSATFFHVWATDEMPVDLGDDAMARQRKGSAGTARGSGSGSVLRIGVLEPGSRSPMHRTESLDYGICLEGECVMELDSGEEVTVRAGDIVIQRGTNHLWHNRATVPCRFAWILLDADAVEVGGERLGASWRNDT